MEYNTKYLKENIRKLNQDSGIKSRALLILFIIVAFTACATGCFRKGEVIEEIGNYAITTADYEEFYNSSVEMVTRLANVDKKSVARYLCSPDHPLKKQIAAQLDPERNYKRYRDLRMVEQVAKQDGFLDRPVVKNIIEQSVLETVSKLYIQEKMEKYLKISERQKEEKCEELRREDPQRFRHLPLDDCIFWAERVIAEDQFKKYYPVLIEEIKERVQVKKNEKLDKEKYLKHKVEAHQALLKSGGCEADEKGESEKTQKEKEDKKSTTSP